jgi:FkbM family methyltransferase
MTIFEQVDFLIGLRDRFGISLDYERILQRHYTRFLKAGDVVFDIGGNEGVHAGKFAEIVGSSGRVLVFEPIADLACQLQKRYEPKQSFVAIHNVALSNFRGRSEFVLAGGVLSESGLKQRQYSNPALVEPVPILVDVACLDDFTRGFDRLDYMKLDIEGGELDCLAGGEDALRRLRPVLSVEYGAESYRAYGHERADLWRVCERYGYSVFDILGNLIPDASTWDRVCDRVYWDYLCVPIEKCTWFEACIGPGRAAQEHRLK